MRNASAEALLLKGVLNASAEALLLKGVLILVSLLIAGLMLRE